MNEITKTCKVCQTEKSVTDFHSHKSCRNGVRPECKDCFNEKSTVRSQLYRNSYPVKRHATILKHKYGISYLEFENLLKSQNCKCKICKTPDPGKYKKYFSVDHCHKTNEIRGLLCHTCNVGLGSFKDRIELLAEAINYLKEANNG